MGRGILMIHEANSITKYIKIVTKLKSEGFEIFRGQRYSKKYKLLPSILRYDKDNKLLYSKKCDTIFLNMFKTKAIKYVENIPSNNWEWMFCAQHYELPTRLLDWTESPLIALYFALETATMTQEENPIVWSVNPYLLNSLSIEIESDESIPNLFEDDDCFKFIEQNYSIKATKTKYPIVVSGLKNNARIEAQQGLFCLYPINGKPLEEFKDKDDYLQGIEINKETIDEIKKDLFFLGIKKINVFPELQSISKDIVFEYNNMEVQ